LCEHIIVDDAELLPQVLNTVAKWAGMSRPQEGWSSEKRPRAYIVTLINIALEQVRGAGRRNADFDAALAVENAVLAAEEQGLGSCIITSFSPEKLRQVLNIPTKYDIAILTALGYPDEAPVITTDDSSIRRWRDAEDVLHVPKRGLAGVLHRNCFV
jgi:nitroreductase